jgi:hypothetical protein
MKERVETCSIAKPKLNQRQQPTETLRGHQAKLTKSDSLLIIKRGRITELKVVTEDGRDTVRRRVKLGHLNISRFKS